MNKKKILFVLFIVSTQFTDSIVNSKLAAIISIIKENKMHRKKEQSQFEGTELLVSISRRGKCISYKSHREHLFTELCRPTCADWARKWSDGAEFPGTE